MGRTTFGVEENLAVDQRPQFTGFLENRYHQSVFMWLHRSRWLDSTALCSGKVRPERLRLTEGSMKRHAQKEDKRRFFSNMTTVLPLLGLVGGDGATC